MTMRLICDRCRAEWTTGGPTRDECVHIGDKWYDLCSECIRIYQSIEDKVQDYRADLYADFLSGK